MIGVWKGVCLNFCLLNWIFSVAFTVGTRPPDGTAAFCLLMSRELQATKSHKDKSLPLFTGQMYVNHYNPRHSEESERSRNVFQSSKMHIVRPSHRLFWPLLTGKLSRRLGFWFSTFQQVWSLAFPAGDSDRVGVTRKYPESRDKWLLHPDGRRQRTTETGAIETISRPQNMRGLRLPNIRNKLHKHFICPHRE